MTVFVEIEIFMKADTGTIAEQNAKKPLEKIFLQTQDMANFVGGYKKSL